MPKDIDLQDLIKIVTEIQERDRQKKVNYENKIVINLPKPYVIVLEESRDVPDKYEFTDKDVSVKTIIKTMLNEFGNKIGPYKKEIENNSN